MGTAIFKKKSTVREKSLAPCAKFETFHLYYAPNFNSANEKQSNKHIFLLLVVITIANDSSRQQLAGLGVRKIPRTIMHAAVLLGSRPKHSHLRGKAAKQRNKLLIYRKFNMQIYLCNSQS
jgi:hypothetical protein